MDENSGDDIDDLLDECESPKEETKPKPGLVGVSKPRPGLTRQRSNSLEDDEGHTHDEPEVNNGHELLPKKPLLGLSHVPITARPKTNPNANLLGNPFFGNEVKGPAAGPPSTSGTKFLAKGPVRPDPSDPFKAPLPPTLKTEPDWLGFGSGGRESPITIHAPPPKKLGTKAGGGGDPFELHAGGSNFNPRGVSQNDELSLPKMKGQKFQEPTELAPKKLAAPVSDLPPFLETLTNSRKPLTPPIESDPDGKLSSGGIRKKVVVVRKSPGTSESTLQVPSHVIDQEELKRMFVSQKQLYENQLEMMENGYKEQMDFLVQSYSRKEEMLKEEMKLIQKDYDERMGRLKGELLEAEMKPLQSRAQNQESFHLISSLAEQLKNLQENLSNRSRPDPSFPDDLNQILDIKLSTFLTAVDTSFGQRLAENGRSQSHVNEEMMQRLDRISSQYETGSKLVANSEDNQEKTIKRLESELSKMLKEQKRLRDTLVKSTVTSMTQSLETKHEDVRKKDKLSTQVREFRKDFQRLLIDFENKQESVQKSQATIQGEQKGINQSLHDLLTWLKVNHEQRPLQHDQSSVQNEMELRLLKEERTGMSETIAQMNVDKRRLSDEKAQVEVEKRDIERRRLQIHDLETTLRIKISDAEETKKEAESLRAEQMKLSAEISQKTKELEKEKTRYREMSQATEVTTGHQKQRQSEERAELLRERDFLEKLRLQSLCPACLRLVRSQGDGGDTVSAPVKVYPSLAQYPLHQVSQGESDIEREAKQLNQMIANYYGHYQHN